VTITSARPTIVAVWCVDLLAIVIVGRFKTSSSNSPSNTVLTLDLAMRFS
jgi:hypothetical protein